MFSDKLNELDTQRKINLIEGVLRDYEFGKAEKISDESKIVTDRKLPELLKGYRSSKKSKYSSNLMTYALPGSLMKKWIKVRNVVVAVMRMNKIMRDVINYGTSEKLFNKHRDLSLVRDFMLPELKK